MTERVILFGALAAIFVGLTVIAAVVLGMGARRSGSEEEMRRRLSLYTMTGRTPRIDERHEQRTVNRGAVARGAVEAAGRLARRRGFDDALDARLEAAALPIKAAEWSLIHLGVAIGLAVLLLVASHGSLLATVLGLAIGAIGPWAFLVIREGRREGDFLAQLPDALQLLAGSLQAGYSLPQAIDTVVQEGPAPLSAEFNRAMIESRLGIPIEDALESIAERMSSQDFSWVVMAIRIQREVGGNLAELLTTVADTLRERDRLRRQVRVLSAEGRLSGWILGALPPVFAIYLVVFRPDYIGVLASPLGLVLILIAVLLLAVGAFWISRVVKVQV